MMGGRGGTSRGRRNSATLGLTSLILRGFPAWTSLPSNGSPSLSLLLLSSGFSLILFALSFPSGTRARRAHVQDDYCTPGTGWRVATAYAISTLPPVAIYQRR